MGKWVHRLSEVDEVTRTAVCQSCGPTTVRVKGHTKNGSTVWECNVGDRAVPHLRDKKAHCERCGFIAQHRRQLDVHHKDGNHSNDDPTNHETLCANCHRLEHAN